MFRHGGTVSRRRFFFWVSTVRLRRRTFKKRKIKNGKNPKKKTDDNRTRDDRVRLTGAYDYMKAARGVVSFSRRRRRRRRPPPPPHHLHHHHAAYVGWRGAFTHTGTGGAVRGGMTGGGTNRNTPRVRVRAGVRRARAPSAVRGPFRPRRRRFSSPSKSDVVRTDLQNFRPPPPSLLAIKSPSSSSSNFSRVRIFFLHLRSPKGHA